MGLTGHVLVLYTDGGSPNEFDRFCLSDREDALKELQEMRQEFPDLRFWLQEEYIRADDDPRGA